MTIGWNHFTPWAFLAGGLLLGLSASAIVLLNGRMLGIGGTLGGVLRAHRGDIGCEFVCCALLLNENPDSS